MTGGPEASLCRVYTIRYFFFNNRSFNAIKHRLLIEFYLRICQSFGNKNVKLLGFKTTQFWVKFGCTKFKYRVSMIPVVRLVHLISSASAVARSLIKDPHTDLACTIPVRIYGDGAEAQRSSLNLEFTSGIFFGKSEYDQTVTSPLFWRHSGKQKFEMITIQFPRCSSSATLQNRILRPSCKSL